jgi:hypothetical protein
MERVGEHPVPAGPLAVRWLAYELPALKAGSWHECRLVLANAGAAPWRELKLAYHWLDDRGNPIVWDGWRTKIAATEPGGEVEVEARVQAPIPPGRYRLAFDAVVEGRFWLAEIGNARLERDVAVGPRIARRLAVVGRVVTGQEEPLVPEAEAEAIAYLALDCEPAPDWSRRVLDAHQEGYAVVAGSVDGEGGGRNPAYPGPFACPSLVRDARGEWVEGELPTFRPAEHEPALYDGRIRVRRRSGRRRG